MNYENISDFEINKAVAELQSLIINEQQGASLKASSSSVLVNCITESWEFNPCNNPSDAWPIIVENKISVTSTSEEERPWCAYRWEDDCEAWGVNPLRQCMIVYLMMQEQANETQS